jgi:hypothetical protein
VLTGELIGDRTMAPGERRVGLGCEETPSARRWQRRVGARLGQAALELLNQCDAVLRSLPVGRPGAASPTYPSARRRSRASEPAILRGLGRARLERSPQPGAQRLGLGPWAPSTSCRSPGSVATS